MRRQAEAGSGVRRLHPDLKDPDTSPFYTHLGSQFSPRDYPAVLAAVVFDLQPEVEWHVWRLSWAG